MAEQDKVTQPGATTGSKDTATPGAVATDPGLTREDLNRLWSAIDARLTPVEMSSQQLATELKGLLGDTRQTRALVQRIAENNLTPEDLTTIANAQKAADLEDKASLLEKELKELKSTPEITREQIAIRDYNEIYLPQALRYARKQGRASLDGVPRPKERIVTPDDPEGWLRFMEEFEANIDQTVLAEAEAGKTKASVEDSRPTGGMAPLSSFDKIKQGIAEQMQQQRR